MVRADFECFYEALRDRILDVWDVNLILESGGEIVTVDPETANYPWAIIELNMNSVRSENGPALKDVTFTFPFYLWIVKEKTPSIDDVEGLREDISCMVTEMGRDPYLFQTATNIEYQEQSWTGAGRQWPVEPLQGITAIAGYSGYMVQIVESRI